MKKVININFQGQVIAIEETAYEMLKQYIERLTLFFAREEGGDEIVNDIECRIAELFGNRLKHGINCITDEDVQSIISSIGQPEEFDNEYEEPSTTAHNNTADNKENAKTFSARDREQRSLYRNSGDQILGGVCSGLAHYFKTDPVWIRILFVLFFGFLFWVYIVLWIVLKPKALETNVSKRLYRNPNDKYLGGICGGIAAYFKIDSWIPRVVFLFPLLFNLIGMFSSYPLNFLFRNFHLFDHIDFSWNFNMGVVLAYIVLWIIIPEAKSVKQKLEMMGEEEYIRSIREKVNDNVSTTRSRNEMGVGESSTVSSVAAENVDAADHVSMDAIPPVPHSGEPIGVMSSGSRPTSTTSAERSGCLNALILFLKIVFFFMVGVFALVLIGVFVAMLFAGTQLIPLKSLFVDPGRENMLLITSLILLMGMPILSILIWIVRRVMKAKSRPWIGVVCTILWLGGLFTIGLLAVRVTDKFSEESSLDKTVELEPITSKSLYVEMQPYHDDYSEFRVGWGPGSSINQLPYTNVDKDSLLFRNIHLQIRNSSDSLFHVRTLLATRGRDLREAKADLKQFKFDVTQQDSLLYLSEFLMVPIDQGFRDQSITVEILVPTGKTVEVSDMLDNYRSNEPPAVVRKRIREYTSTYLTVDPYSTELDDSEADHKEV